MPATVGMNGAMKRPVSFSERGIRHVGGYGATTGGQRMSRRSGIRFADKDNKGVHARLRRAMRQHGKLQRILAQISQDVVHLEWDAL
jgi:hypothetical protein